MAVEKELLIEKVGQLMAVADKTFQVGPLAFQDSNTLLNRQSASARWEGPPTMRASLWTRSLKVSAQ